MSETYNNPLAKYEEAFRENSLLFSGFDINIDNDVIHDTLGGYETTFQGISNMTIDLSFRTRNINIKDPNTLFYLMLDALFSERYGMKLKEFENTYPEVAI